MTAEAVEKARWQPRPTCKVSTQVNRSKRQLERFAGSDFLVLDKKLRGALGGAADGGQKASHLLAGDESERPAGRTGKHRPVRIFALPYFARIFQDEHGTGLHLFGNPLVDNAQFADHHCSPLSVYARRARRRGRERSETADLRD